MRKYTFSVILKNWTDYQLVGIFGLFHHSVLMVYFREAYGIMNHIPGLPDCILCKMKTVWSEKGLDCNQSNETHVIKKTDLLITVFIYGNLPRMKYPSKVKCQISKGNTGWPISLFFSETSYTRTCWDQMEKKNDP